jgi:putative tricarboxylic transport membrane protein
LLFAAGAQGQSQFWRPSKPIEIISPSSPGGSTDTTARTIQKIMQQADRGLVPLTVVNKSGGNQAVAIAYLNQHAGDAHYIAIANPSLNSNYLTGISDSRYLDVTPLALLSGEYTVFTVLAASPVKRISDLAAILKKAPESVAIGITTRGGANHLVLCLVARALGVDVRKLKVVSFRSNGESITALLGGHIQMVVSTVAASIDQVTIGSARFIAVGSPQRLGGSLANTPTLREQGIDVTKANWRLVVGAKKLGKPEIAYWEEALRRMSRSADWRAALEKEYWTDTFLVGRELNAFLESEYSVDKTLLSELGLTK